MGHQETKTYRVAQWATGNIGTHAAKAVLAHPRMELVGLWVHSDAKAGKDAGEVLGLGRTLGITATRDIEAIVALKPDCVLYAPRIMDIEAICRLLESGVNIVTSVAEFHAPDDFPPEIRQHIEAACHRGGTALHSTGASPGFSTELLPTAITAMVRRLDCFTIDEYADMSSRNSPGMIFDVMGFGKPPGTVNEERVQRIGNNFGKALRHMAKAHEIQIDRFESFGEFGTARVRTDIAAGVIEAGTVAAQRFTVAAYRGTLPVLRFRANWYCTRDIEQADWDLRAGGWRVQVEGDPPIDIGISFPCAPEDWPRISPGLTAYPVVNAVPAVCAAEPGIRTNADLKIFSIL